MKKNNIQPGLLQKGFSLVELLVVISIVVTITTVVLVEYTNFNSQTLLNITAQEISATIRQAQYFGIAVRGETNDNINYEFPNYGIYVESVSSPNQVILFADLDGTPGFDAANDFVVETYKVPQQYAISRLCIDEDGISGGELCSISDGLTEINILFKRPESEPTINSNLRDDVVLAQIYLADSVGAELRRVEVWNTGQISVYDL